MEAQSDDLPATEEGDDDLGKRTRSMTNKLVTMVNGYAVDRNRIRNLVLFEERRAEKNTRPISKVNNYDRPEVELILYHRDRCRALDGAISQAELGIACAKKQIDESNIDYVQCLAASLSELSSLEAKKAKHLAAIENLLAQMTKEMSLQETIMARLAADAASLAQKASEHRDKMDLARKSGAIPTTAELKQRLALKYNVPIEQVEAVLAAKMVDAEASD
jgi:hypothetical protein